MCPEPRAYQVSKCEPCFLFMRCSVALMAASSTINVNGRIWRPISELSPLTKKPIINVEKKPQAAANAALNSVGELAVSGGDALRRSHPETSPVASPKIAGILNKVMKFAMVTFSQL